MGSCCCRAGAKSSKIHAETPMITSHDGDHLDKGEAKLTINKAKIAEILNYAAKSGQNIKKYHKLEVDKLGKGKFGTVRLGHLKNDESQKYAVKTIIKNRMKGDIESLSKEVELLMKQDHPNIVRFYERYEDNDYFHIVMEFCPGGTLIDKIVDKGIIDENVTAKYMWEIFTAISHLHKIGICHRDLKAENFQLDNDGNLKLIDFGLAKNFVDTNTKFHDVVGSPLYVAPEIIFDNYDYRCDIWSAGVIMFILLTGKPPFQDLVNKKGIFDRILSGRYDSETLHKSNASLAAIDLIEKIQVVDVDTRADMNQILNHPYFDNVDPIRFSNEELDEMFNDELLEIFREYGKCTKFQKLLYSLIANLFHEEFSVYDQSSLFLYFDYNKNGYISKEEWVQRWFDERQSRNMLKDGKFEIDEAKQIFHNINNGEPIK